MSASRAAARAAMSDGSSASSAARIARHHTAHAWLDRSSACVIDASRIAARTMPCGSACRAIATPAVRISAPLPPLLPGRRASLASATARNRSPSPGAGRVATSPNTAAEWMPMSLSRAGERYHSCSSAATASSPAMVRRSAPSAAAIAMASSWAVSSVHSPGSNAPCPRIVTGRSAGTGPPNSYPAPSASAQAAPIRTPVSRSAVTSCAMEPPRSNLISANTVAQDSAELR